MNGKRLFGSLVVGTLSWWALAVPSLAATATDATAAPTSQGAELQEVIVTARHERENLQVVPISITAISGEDIRQKNIVSPDDFNTSVPGLTVAATSLDRASVTYTIRGQGQILGGPDPAVATSLKLQATDLFNINLAPATPLWVAIRHRKRYLKPSDSRELSPLHSLAANHLKAL